MKRKLFVGAAMILAMVVMPIASAVELPPPIGSVTNGTGMIRAGHPGTVFTPGVTEAAFRFPCGNVSSAAQGVDGWAIALGGNNTLTLDSSSGFPNGPYSLNFVFYNSVCAITGLYNGISVQRKSWPTSKVPAGSTYLVVSGAYGANITLNYTLSSMP